MLGMHVQLIWCAFKITFIVLMFFFWRKSLCFDVFYVLVLVLQPQFSADSFCIFEMILYSSWTYYFFSSLRTIVSDSWTMFGVGWNPHPIVFHIVNSIEPFQQLKQSFIMFVLLLFHWFGKEYKYSINYVGNNSFVGLWNETKIHKLC